MPGKGGEPAVSGGKGGEPAVSGGREENGPCRGEGRRRLVPQFYANEI